jgi:hypothetical protein
VLRSPFAVPSTQIRPARGATICRSRVLGGVRPFLGRQRLTSLCPHHSESMFCSVRGTKPSGLTSEPPAFAIEAPLQLTPRKRFDRLRSSLQRYDLHVGDDE